MFENFQFKFYLTNKVKIYNRFKKSVVRFIMKIAFLSAFYPFKGGIAKFNSFLVNELIAQNHEVKAFTFTTQYPSFLVKNQFAEKKYDNDIEGFRILSSINPFTWLRTIKQINNFSPDLMVLRYWVPQLAPCLVFVSRYLKKSIKIITIVDNAIPHEKGFFDKLLNRYFFKKQNNFIAMSQEVKNDILSVKKNANITVTPHPLYDYGEKTNKAEALKNLGMHQDKKTLLFFGLIRDYKGLDILINAFSELDDSYQLLIAGECRKNLELYKKLINESKNQNIKFINNFIPDNEVNLYFSAADVCVLPYRSATQSGIAAIAYHFEIPIIVTNVGGLPELITADKTGVIAEYATPSSLQLAICNLFVKDNFAEYLQNVRQAKSMLTWERFAKCLV